MRAKKKPNPRVSAEKKSGFFVWHRFRTDRGMFDKVIGQNVQTRAKWGGESLSEVDGAQATIPSTMMTIKCCSGAEERWLMRFSIALNPLFRLKKNSLRNIYF